MKKKETINVAVKDDKYNRDLFVGVATLVVSSVVSFFAGRRSGRKRGR